MGRPWALGQTNLASTLDSTPMKCVTLGNVLTLSAPGFPWVNCLWKLVRRIECLESAQPCLKFGGRPRVRIASFPCLKVALGVLLSWSPSWEGGKGTEFQVLILLHPHFQTISPKHLPNTKYTNDSHTHLEPQPPL